MVVPNTATIISSDLRGEVIGGSTTLRPTCHQSTCRLKTTAT